MSAASVLAPAQWRVPTAAGPPRQRLSFRERVLLQFRAPENQRYIAAAFAYACRPGGARTPAGEARLAALLAAQERAVDVFASTYGQGGALLDSDPLAIRGSAARGGNLLEELRALNQAFFQERMRAVEYDGAPSRDPLTGAASQVGAGEPLFYRMFEADSLRPPGLEDLNGPGPTWALDEDQAHLSLLQAQTRGAPVFAAAAPRPGGGGVEGFAGRPAGLPAPAAPPDGAAAADFAATYDPSVPASDRGWRAGAPRTPEQAVAEYFGEDSPFAETMGLAGAWGTGVAPNAVDRAGTYVATPGPAGPVVTNMQADAAARERALAGALPAMAGGRCRTAEETTAMVLKNELGGAAGRYQRREGIPLWQQAGHRAQLYTARWQSVGAWEPARWQAGGGAAAGFLNPPADPVSDKTGDTDETLGSGSAEYGGERESPVYRMDMSRFRQPQGETYLTYGPTGYP